MQDIQSFIWEGFYSKHLTAIRNVPFSRREIDVMACLLNARKTSKIAYFLSIDPRTVETHIRNITLKLDCNSREGIIDFLEASDKLVLLRKHYFFLQIESAFEKSLKDIAKLVRRENPACCLVNGDEQQPNTPLFLLLKKHLKVAGITIQTEEALQNKGNLIYILSPNLKDSISSCAQRVKRYQQDKILLLLAMGQKRTDLPKELKEFRCVSFGKHHNYYFYCFDILKKFLPDIAINNIVLSFKEKYEKVSDIIQSEYIQISDKDTKRKKYLLPLQMRSMAPLKKVLVSSFLLVGVIITIGFANFYEFLEHKLSRSPVVRSDLPIPADTVFLERSELLHALTNSFKNQKGIHTVALIGVGGAGKTTLARQFARTQNSSIIWEINSETVYSLISSIEKLAVSLAKTDAEKTLVKSFQEIKNVQERLHQLFLFIRETMKNKSEWLLIFDNVKSFSDIQKYFPYEYEKWGKGKLIITSQDKNLKNCKYINHVLYIEELCPAEKKEMFLKIFRMSNYPQSIIVNEKQLTQFLSDIPSYPLDISIAAYYIKSTHITFEAYLSRLKELKQTFLKTQVSILRENSDYSKTRYSIISLSLKKILDANPNFKDLLIFISLLNSQNVPRNILERYKGDILVDNFLIHLNKYSLIHNHVMPEVGSTISIHRSTQSIMCDYLKKNFQLSPGHRNLKESLTILEAYIHDAVVTQNFSKVKLLINHVKALLDKQNLFNEIDVAKLKNELGHLYSVLDYRDEAQTLLEQTFIYLNTQKQISDPIIARNLTYLGVHYWAEGHFEKSLELLLTSQALYESNSTKDYWGFAKTLVCMSMLYGDRDQHAEKAKAALEKALLIYDKYLPNYYAERAFALSWLGRVSIKIDLKLAKRYLEESISIYKTHAKSNLIHYSWALANFAEYYAAIGDYQKAVELNEQTLKIYQSHFSQESTSVAWALRNLGKNYCGLGNIIKAKTMLETSYKLFKTSVGVENIKTNWVLYELGLLYNKMDQKNKAQQALEKCAYYYYKHYGKEDAHTVNTLINLSKIYLLQNNIVKAEEILRQVFEVYNEESFLYSYFALETLSDLYIQKSKTAVGAQKEFFRNEAKKSLVGALKVLNLYYPKESPHFERIQTKLTNL